MALAAFGVVDMAPLEVSDILKSLNLSHSYIFRQGVRYNTLDIDGLCKQQPVWPCVVDNLRTLRRSVLDHGQENVVFFVTDSRAALSTTNISNMLWPEIREALSIESAVKKALMGSPGGHWDLVVQEPTLMDYVNQATKPSQLNDIQAAFYKINPYAVRKEIQLLCISYLGGFTSFKKLKEKLKTSLKFGPLLDIMSSEKTRQLREAVARLSKETVEEVVKDTGFVAFELNYLSKSAEQNRNKGTDKVEKKTKK